MNQRITWSLVVALAIALGLVRSVAGLAQTPTAEEPLQVVATFSVLGDLAQEVGGEAIDLRTIIHAGADAHTFEPSPDDAIALSQADAIFANGIDLEPWLTDLAQGADKPLPIVVVTDGLTLRTADEATHDAADEPGHGAFDPHVWFDVHNAMAMTKTIRDTLVQADPANAPVYEANAAAYLDRLQTLDSWVVEQVATLPPERRKLITSHDTFGYFADRYGFDIVGTAIGSVSTEGGGGSAREIADLVEQIQAAGVPAIFAENVQNPALMETIAEEAGVKLAPPLYTDALGPAGSGADSYEGLIRYDVATIVGALAG